jgi:hypothetical protein
VAVTPDTIAVALGRPSVSATEEAQWSMWIDDALMLIEARAAVLDITDPLDPAKLDYVVREAVVAHVRRPDDSTQVTHSVNDASVTRTFRSSRGRIEILDEWWVLLGLTSAQTGIFSIDTAYGAGVHADICALNFGSTYCSCGADLTNYAYPLWEVDW